MHLKRTYALLLLTFISATISLLGGCSGHAAEKAPEGAGLGMVIGGVMGGPPGSAAGAVAGGAVGYAQGSAQDEQMMAERRMHAEADRWNAEKQLERENRTYTPPEPYNFADTVWRMSDIVTNDPNHNFTGMEVAFTDGGKSITTTMFSDGRKEIAVEDYRVAGDRLILTGSNGQQNVLRYFVEENRLTVTKGENFAQFLKE